MDRRTVLGLGVAAFAGVSARAHAKDEAAMLDPTETVPLWPGTPPGGAGLALQTKIEELSTDLAVYRDRSVTRVGTPLLTVFRPDRPDGSAVIIAPGGGYVRQVIDTEGTSVARRLNASGVTAFVLRYRLPGEGWAGRADVPLQDAQRAMRVVRASAPHFAVDPARLGIMGFSAGGHLAAQLATRFAERVYAPIDGADAADAKPAFAALMYPVITMGQGTQHDTHDNLLGPDPSPAEIAANSCDKAVTGNSAPCFICYAADDDIVEPMANGMAMYRALIGAKVPAELHVFANGGHGFAIRLAKGNAASIWPELFLHWGYGNGWLRDPSARPA